MKAANAWHAATEREQRCREALQKAEALLTRELPEQQKRTVVAEREKRAGALQAAELDTQVMRAKHNEITEEMKDACAYLVRAEVVRFCRSPRYALTPVNFANAFAGLPYIRARQSIKRCRGWEADNGSYYRMIEIVRRIVLSCSNRTELSPHAKERLTNIRVKKSDKNLGALARLGESFYYLRRAIEAVVSTRPRTSELAERIMAEYSRLYSPCGPADEFFADEERIVIKSK
jgi:hypothetical protein